MIMLGAWRAHCAMLEKNLVLVVFSPNHCRGKSQKHSMSFVKTSPVFKQVRPSAVRFSVTFPPIRGQSFGMLASDWLERKLDEKTTFESPWYVAVCQRRLVNGAFKSGDVIVPIRTMHEWAIHG
jgi:hypothetical protein